MERATNGESLALFFDVGTGKTRTIVEILSWHFSQGRRRALIFAPPVVLENWRREIQRYSDLPKDLILVLKGPKRERLKMLNAITLGIVITNYESLLMEELYKALCRFNFNVMVCDESHKLKASSAKRTKSAIKIAKEISFKYLLTGTPVLNTPLDLFSQYQVMLGGFPYTKHEVEYVEENGEIRKVIKEKSDFINSFFHYRNYFFYDANAGMPKQSYFPNWKTKPNSLKEINETIKKTAITIKKKDCLDLPPLVKTVLEVDMTKEQTQIYEEMFRDFIAFIDGKAAVAPLAVTKALRLQQIVTGFVTMEDSSVKRFPNNRIDVLEELLLELTPEHKVIVWAVFKENYGQIKAVCDKHKIPYTELHGGTVDKQRSADIFNEDPKCRVIIANQIAGGVGINLTASDYSIYYSRNFSSEADIQSEARNYRGGSEIHERITRIDLVTPNTIDEVVLKRLSTKQGMSDAVLLQAIKEDFYGKRNRN